MTGITFLYKVFFIVKHIDIKDEWLRMYYVSLFVIIN